MDTSSATCLKPLLRYLQIAVRDVATLPNGSYKELFLQYLCVTCTSSVVGNGKHNYTVSARTNETWRRFRVNIVCSATQRVVTYSGCVSVALVIQLAKRMRRIVSSSVACLALHSAYLFNGTDIDKMC